MPKASLKRRALYGAVVFFAAPVLTALGQADPVRSETGSGETLRAIEVVGSQFRLTTASGHILSQDELIGAVVAFSQRNGSEPITLRIDWVAPDPRDADIMLYGLSVRDPKTGAWGNLCKPDPDGVRAGFPLQTGPGKCCVLACTSGAQGKCVRFGYKPWATGPQGTALAPYWEACIRMVRADYCGKGVPSTRNGMLIEPYDDLNIRPADHLTKEFEAGWTPAGAVCVHHVRVKENISLDRLVADCPRLSGRVGSICSEAEARGFGALLFNRSVP